MAGRKKPETGKMNITVRGGVNVNDQRYGDTKGDYFKGFAVNDNTIFVQKDERRYWKIILEDQETGGRYEFMFSYEMLIGRTPPRNNSEVKLVLDKDGAVSGDHCKIYEMANRLVIADLGSKNHTFLNGMQIQQPTEIPPWGQIQVGRSSFRVVYVAKN